MQQRALEVDRSAIGDTRLVDDELPAPTELSPGQVRLRIDSFAITANNITYAVFGDVLAYWEFFPTGDARWGRVPAMGWAEIVETAHEDLAVGSRYYGWFPMAQEVVFTATKTADGFRDDGDHRQPHAPVYRAYVDTSTDPLYDDADDGEDRHSLLRGLFLTGFLAEEFFGDSSGTVATGAAPYFGAEQVVVLSASSKTAIGFAQRAQERGVARVVGVTSAGNVDFVSSLGFYDEVLAYDNIATLSADRPSVSIDMAGNPAVLGAVHHHFGDRLLYSMTVGRSHHDAPDVVAPTGGLPGPQPQLFFAPTEVSRRMKEWGRDEYGQRAAAACASFVDGSRSWLSIEKRTGAEGAASAWADVHGGSVAPSSGVIVSLHD